MAEVISQRKSLVAGYSLLELLVTISITAILLLMTIPSWQQWVLRQREQTDVTQILAGLQFTRAVAMSLQANIIYCASSDKKNCGEKWDDGQIVQNLQTHRVLHTFPALSQATHIKWQSSFDLDHSIEFAPSGFTLDQQGSFYICGKSSSQGFRLRLLRSGRVTIEDYLCV